MWPPGPPHKVETRIIVCYGWSLCIGSVDGGMVRCVIARVSPFLWGSARGDVENNKYKER